MLEQENNKLKNLKNMLEQFNRYNTETDGDNKSLNNLFKKLSDLNTICETSSKDSIDMRVVPSIAIDLST